AQNEICADRNQLVAWGFAATDFAYPYGSWNQSVRGLVQSCGYQSSRTIGAINSPGDPASAFAETLPPADPYVTQTPDSVENTWTLAQIEALVTQAETHGGGWVQIVFHHVCASRCPDEYSVAPATLSAFLDWLAARAPSGTVTKTVHEALTGTTAPPDTTP